MSQAAGPEGESRTVEEAMQGRLSRLADYSLGIWAFYFVAKLTLYWMGLIGFHFVENLVFAAFILFPVRNVIGRWIKQVVTVWIALVLLYYDSWLPAFERVISQAALVSGFSTSYLIELAGRFISIPVVAMLLAAALLYWIVSRWIRMDSVVIVVMMGMPAIVYFQPADSPAALARQQGVDETDWYQLAAQPISTNQPDKPDLEMPASSAVLAVQAEITGKSGPPVQALQSRESDVAEAAEAAEPGMNRVLQRFFKQESLRSVSFPVPKPEDAPFDVIFVHVCSLSWDDLKVTGLENHPLWRRFDILLTRFNSASTYSGPAAIRMQRASCGQSAHADLYTPAPAQCYLMDSLKSSGLEPGLVLNHDGHFDDFLKIVQGQGKFSVPPLPLDGVTVNQHAFDDSPIYEDISVLNRWLETRQKLASPRMAMYYNTVSLHDGNHLAGANAKLNSRENFKIRLTKLLDDLDQFLQNIEKSGRNAVVAIVPEHGAALRGDRMQIAGLREIPSPSITLVPVGIKIVGNNIKRTGGTLKVNKPTSYLAVSYIVSRLLANSPYNNGSFVPSEYVADLPVTPFVSQNEGMVVAGYKGRYYLRQDESEWVDYTDF